MKSAGRQECGALQVQETAISPSKNNEREPDACSAPPSLLPREFPPTPTTFKSLPESLNKPLDFFDRSPPSTAAQSSNFSLRKPTIVKSFGLQATSTMRPLAAPLLLLLGLVLLPTSVSANAGTDSVGGANAAVGAGWAAPAAIIATLRSLSIALQSLFTRLASARVARGDHAGAERARSIANTFGNSLQWWTGVGTMSWDYVTNYFFSQSASRGIGLSQAMGHLSDLSSIVQELTQLGSDNERLQWLARNYSRAFAVAKSALGNLLSIFDTDGAIRNCVLAIQREVLEGDLLRDVLRLGPTDLEAIVKMVKDVLQRVFAPAPQVQRGDL